MRTVLLFSHQLTNIRDDSRFTLGLLEIKKFIRKVNNGEALFLCEDDKEIWIENKRGDKVSSNPMHKIIERR